jgi:uncharacterized protein YtpQ (UPF0354 family)
VEASNQLHASTVKERSGPLWAVAERFIAQRAAARIAQASAREQVRALARTLDAFVACEQASPKDEHAFVEGAGAWLGVILIAHLPRAKHESSQGKHRIKLGRHGYYDPFRAIEAALDHDEPRCALARELGLAEAEHRGDGPLARVVRTFGEQLRESRPDLAIVQHFDGDLAVGSERLAEPFRVDLRRAVDSTREQDAQAVQRVVKRLVSMLPSSHTGDTDLTPDRERLFPRLSRAGLLAELSTEGRTALWQHALEGDLTVALQVESEGRARYVRESEAKSLSLSSSALYELALENLERVSRRFRLFCEHTSRGPLYVARTGDGRDSARLLLPALHAALVERLGEAPFVGVPHRDTFFACSADRLDVVEELRARTEHDAARAPHRLSAEVYRLLGPGRLSPCSGSASSVFHGQ